MLAMGYAVAALLLPLLALDAGPSLRVRVVLYCVRLLAFLLIVVASIVVAIGEKSRE